MKNIRPKWKARDLEVTPDFLTERIKWSAKNGWGKAKWIEFCETMLENGLSMTLYEAKKSRSKYIKVNNGNKTFKVRFSNHKPIKHREVNGDCDFFVGQTNLGRTSTIDAVKATLDFLIQPDQIEA